MTVSSFCLGYGVRPMVLHVGVNPSSHCRCGGGGSFCLGYGVLPMVLHIGVNPSSHCRCVGGYSF